MGEKELYVYQMECDEDPDVADGDKADVDKTKKVRVCVATRQHTQEGRTRGAGYWVSPVFPVCSSNAVPPGETVSA